YALATVSVMVAFLLAALGASILNKRHELPSPADPLVDGNSEAALQDIFHDFRPDAKTALLALSGKPRWLEVPRGTTRPQLSWTHGALAVDSLQGLGPVLLVPNAPAQRYTLRAEVRHDADDGREGAHSAGIFVRASERITQEGWENCFLMLTFVETGKSLQ